MQKYGRVLLKKSEHEFQFSWADNELDFERIDVFNNFNNYNPADTSNCIAAYYRKGREYYLGEDSIIKDIKQTILATCVLDGEVGQNVEFIDGEIHLTTTKDNDKVGMHQKTVLINGRIDTQYYETADAIVEIYKVDKERGIDIKPVNIDEYQVYSVSTGVKVASGDADYYSVEYLKSVHPIEHIEQNDFVVVQSLEEARERLKRFREAPTKVKSIDLETTGKDIGLFGPDIITGIVLSYAEDESTYYPFRQDRCTFNLDKVFMDEILSAINNQPEDVVIVGHNAKFEKEGIQKERPVYLKNSPYLEDYEGVDGMAELKSYYLRIDVDTYILSVLCNPIQQKGLHSLKGIVYRLTGLFYLELSDIFKDSNNIKFNVLPPEIIRLYACPDPANTIKVYNRLIEVLPKSELDILRLECELLDVIVSNESYGLRINQKKLIDKIENEEYKVSMLGDMFRGMHHTSKNINSPDVRRDIFYNQLRCPVDVRTKKNQPSTSTIALQRILELGELRKVDETKAPPDIKDLNGNVIVKGVDLISNRYPSLVILDKYAKASKELGAYKRIRSKSEKGRVQFYINQVGAGSGRETSDAHQYSDGMKELVMADTNDHWLWSADYKQVELRILAYLAQQKDLIELETDPCVDVHRAILSIIKHKDMWAITADERKAGKAVNFGVVYLMTYFGLAKRLFGAKPSEEELRIAAESITSFYNGLPKIKMFIEGNKEIIKSKGYISTKLGRRRLFPRVFDPAISEKELASIIRAGNNTPVQGFGADLIKIVQTSINSYIKEKGWDELVPDEHGNLFPKVRLMLSIHDEVLVSSHKSIPVEEIITMFKVCMEIDIPDAPPFFSAPALITNWLDGKNDSYEIDLLFRDEIVDAWNNQNHKRLLHVNTYYDFDYIEMKEITKLCEDLRSNFLTDADYDGGSYKLSKQTYCKVKLVLSPEEYDRLDKCYISERDSFENEDERSFTVIERALNKNYSHYLEDLNHFRSQRLNEYMYGLINEYKTVDEVANHVRHPELTHTLISVMLGKKAKKMDHLEAIHEATRLFIEQRGAKAVELFAQAKEDNSKDFDSEESMKTYGDISRFVSVDENGELIVEEYGDFEEEEDNVEDLEYAEEVNSKEIVQQYVQFTLSEALIDISDFDSLIEADVVNQEVARLSKPDAHYLVLYLYRGKIRKSHLHVDYKDKEAIEEIVRKYIGGKLNAAG